MLALRAVIAVALAGSLLVQCVIAPLLWQDLEQARPEARIPLVVIVVLGVLTMQVRLHSFPKPSVFPSWRASTSKLASTPLFRLQS